MLVDNEGSLVTEDSDVDDAEETQESTNEDSENSTDSDISGTKTEDEANADSDSTLKDQEQDKPELTEKGTKLDSNPLSRVNQELANERAKIRQYEDVLNNPDLLRKYVAQFEQPAKEERTGEPEIRIEDVQTTQDLQKFLKQEQGKVQVKVKELESAISGVKSTQQATGVASRIQTDIAQVREEYPELNPKDSSYNKELDTAVGQLYEKFDLDTKTNAFRGQVSIKDIADIVMRAAGSSKKQGSTEAQTVIRDKRTGKAVSGASASSAPDESSMTPGQIIAARIARAAENRGR